MRVMFDSVMLSMFLDPKAKPPKPIDRPKARVEFLVQTLSEANGKILIPTPALSEFLTMPDAERYLPDLENSDVFEVVPFDKAAAIENAAQARKAIAEGDKKSGAQGPYQKVKVDRQIVAIAKFHQVDCIYSDDADVMKLGQAVNLPVVGLESLPIPPEEAGMLPLEDVEATSLGSSSVSLPPAPQSPDAEQVKAPAPAQGLPSSPPDVQAPQQQDSSPVVPPPSQSKK